MKYIVRKRYKKRCIQGYLNLPFGTKVESYDDIIYYNNKPVCMDTSQDAFDYFVSDDDSQGLERIKLVNWILDHTDIDKVKDKTKYEKIWGMIWSNIKYHKFKRQDINDRWFWDKGFYTAKIEDLQSLVNDIKIIEQGDR